jgi:hypothetical protein
VTIRAAAFGSAPLTVATTTLAAFTVAPRLLAAVLARFGAFFFAELAVLIGVEPLEHFLSRTFTVGPIASFTSLFARRRGVLAFLSRCHAHQHRRCQHRAHHQNASHVHLPSG